MTSIYLQVAVYYATILFFYNALLLVGQNLNNNGVRVSLLHSASRLVFGHKADAIGELRLGRERERENNKTVRLLICCKRNKL
jgi:hypothetical protein